MSYGTPPPPPQYGQPYYGGAPLNHPQGTTILVLGILGLVCCAICAPIAWIMGNGALKEIDGSGQVYANRGQIRAGQICGIVGTILAVLGIVAYVLLFALAAGNS